MPKKWGVFDSGYQAGGFAIAVKVIFMDQLVVFVGIREKIPVKRRAVYVGIDRYQISFIEIFKVSIDFDSDVNGFIDFFLDLAETYFKKCLCRFCYF